MDTFYEFLYISSSDDGDQVINKEYKWEYLAITEGDFKSYSCMNIALQLTNVWFGCLITIQLVINVFPENKFNLCCELKQWNILEKMLYYKIIIF